MNYVKYFKLPIKVFNAIFNLHSKIAFVEAQYGNQDIKARRLIIRFFSTTAPFEKKLNKDLCKFNLVEIQNMFMELNIVTKATFENRKSIIKQYLDWCASENLIPFSQEKWLDNFNYENLSINGILKKRYFKSFDDLENGTKAIIDFCNPVDIHQFDIMIIVFYLSWFGLTAKQICNLKQTDIDYKSNCIIIDNIRYNINDCTKQIICNYLKTDGYYAGATMIKGSSEYFDRTYQNTTFLIRRLTSSTSETYEANEIQAKFSPYAFKQTQQFDNINPYKNHKFNLKDIYDSGAFYRLYEYSQKTGVNENNVDMDTLKRILLVSNISISKRTNFIGLYKNWKITFQIN